jgi:serine/threonine-protein kinase
MTTDGHFAHLVGTVLSDRYRIDALLGEGGMGAVFLGEHLLMHKRLAIKLMLPDMSQSGEAVERFMREGLAAAHIDHPNVVAASDFGRTPDGAFFMILEYIEGQTLRHVLNRGPITPARAMRITSQIASALAKAHGMGIVHRDLKPENVMLVDRDGDPDFVKVLDFGIARVPVDALQGRATEAPGLTRKGVMYGTPEYMAPEQAMGGDIDLRVDLYSLGIMLFEMLTGVRPFDADDVVAMVMLHINEPPPLVASRLPPMVVLPPALEALIPRLLAKSPDQRPASAREIVDLLQPLLAAPVARTPTAPAAALANADVIGPTSLAFEGLAPGATQLPPGTAVDGRTGFDPSVSHLTTALPTGLPGPTPTALPGPTPTALIEPPPGSSLAAPGGLAPAPSAVAEALAELNRLKQQLPGPLAAVPLAGYLGGALLALLLVIGLVSRHGDSPGTAPAASSSAATAPTTLSDEQVAEAARAGAPALEALAERFPQDERALSALVKAYQEAKKPSDALKALDRLLKVKPAAASEEQTLLVLRSAIEGPPEAADQAFTLLEGGMGEVGLEILYGLWTAKKEVSSKNQTRAGKILAKPEVRERASKTIRALVDLRLAPASCETRRAGAELAREAGDTRAVPLLQQLTSKRGCGFANLQDCWPCLRKDNLLSEAIKASEKRPEP